MYVFIKFILRDTEREKERERERRRDREGEGEKREFHRLCTSYAEPDMGLKFTNHEIMT